MAAEGSQAPYASKSDAELRAMEKDSTLTPDQWQAVMEERRRRAERAAPASSAGSASARAAGAPPSTGASSLPATEMDSRLARAVTELQALLVSGETLQAFAVQRRLFALTHRRRLAAATSGRFIALERGLFGGYTPVDVRWQDIEDAKLRVGIFGADLVIRSKQNEDLASAGRTGSTILVNGLRKSEAEAVYRIAQGQEQAWREKRRVRDLDEMRARSGGIQLGGAPGVGAAAGAASDDPVARLQRAKEMLAGGLITDAEYESIKAKIVDRL